MSKTDTGARSAKTASAAHHTNPWLEPISEAEPCGPNLEYNTEYAVLFARLAPQADAQYGDFVNKPEAPDWNDIERECRRLLLRSKDVTVLIWLARCRTRLGGAVGLCEALEMLAGIVDRYPDRIHPQLMIDGEPDLAVRANALAALCDPEGLLGDIRDVVVASSTALRLTIRDVERAFAVPHLAEALPPDAVRRQLDDLHAQEQHAVCALARASQLLRQIDRWSRDGLGDEAPDLRVALRLLGWFEIQQAAAPEVATIPSVAAAMASAIPAIESTNEAPLSPFAVIAPPASPSPTISRISASPEMLFGATPLEQREQVRENLRLAKEWLEQYEPSSPVAILLKQAERLLGKRFAEVAQAIPPDLLAKWDAE